jgi:hypothetical protein
MPPASRKGDWENRPKPARRANQGAQAAIMHYE